MRIPLILRRFSFLFWLIAPPLARADTSNLWQYGGTLDLNYTQSLQSDDPSRWRSKATSQRLDQFNPAMGMVYVRKLTREDSRFGLELGAHAGYDTDGQVPANERLPGYSILRYLSRANVSYLAPVGKGLILTAGLMNSFIGFESFYARDNPNYTRSWIADYSPYFLIGAGGQYPVSEQLTAGFYVLSDYDYLAFRGDQPKYATQLTWTPAPAWKISQSVFAGPEQQNAAPGDWRYFSDTIIQWSQDDLMVSLAYDAGTERLMQAGHRQTSWMGSALFTRWHVGGPWTLALRPEIYWDDDGRMTGNRQLIKAITATVEYKIPVQMFSLSFRSEYRHDESTGSGGGFFKRGQDETVLIPGQDLVLFSCLLSLDKP